MICTYCKFEIIQKDPDKFGKLEDGHQPMICLLDICFHKQDCFKIFCDGLVELMKLREHSSMMENE